MRSLAKKTTYLSNILCHTPGWWGDHSWLSTKKSSLQILFLEIRKGYTCMHRRRSVTVLISLAERVTPDNPIIIVMSWQNIHVAASYFYT